MHGIGFPLASSVRVQAFFCSIVQALVASTRVLHGRTLDRELLKSDVWRCLIGFLSELNRHYVNRKSLCKLALSKIAGILSKQVTLCIKVRKLVSIMVDVLKVFGM